MNCKQGDLAYINQALRKENIGLIVECKENLGFHLANDIVEISGERFKAQISDTFWIVNSKECAIETMFGSAREAYIPDSWLTPIKADSDKTSTKTEEELKV